MKTRKPIEPILRDNILILATACAKARGVKMNTLSGEAHSDPQFLDKLKAGACSFTIRKYDAIMVWFDANWPADTPKPAIKEPFPARDKVPT